MFRSALRRFVPLVGLLCVSASFWVPRGMTIQEGARKCEVSRAAFIEANKAIIGYQGATPYLVSGATAVCPASVPPVWSPSKPTSPPAPTMSALQRYALAGAIVATYNPNHNPARLWLASASTGEHFGYLDPDGSVRVWQDGQNWLVAIPGTWQGLRPKKVGTCDCR